MGSAASTTASLSASTRAALDALPDGARTELLEYLQSHSVEASAAPLRGVRAGVSVGWL